MTLRDYVHLFIILICYIPSKIVKWYNNDEIWIISENGTDAKDNGIAFFEYLMKIENRKNTYYVIDKKSKEYDKLKKYKKNLLIHNSLKDLLYTMACKNYISSQLGSSFPFSNVFFNLYMYKIFTFHYVFLQHGITHEKVTCFYKQESNIDLFCCAANPEYEFVKENFGYVDEEITKVGFCRFDYLETKPNNSDGKSILLMPTWRKKYEIKPGESIDLKKQEFIKSDYYQNIQSLINHKKLIELLESNNITLYFCLHDNMKKYKDCFSSPSKNILIIDNEYEKTINMLIRECDFLITDVSSVFFDFAYQNKRIQYFQFDFDDFSKNHWEPGYMICEKNGFGKVTHTVEESIEDIYEAVSCKFKNPEVYEKRIENFFCYRDKENCKRTYTAIKQMQNIKEHKKTKRLENINNNFSWVCIIFSFIFLIIGILKSNPLLLLNANVLVFVSNISYGLLHTKKRIYYILFNCCLFIFCTCKPIIQTFQGERWWEAYQPINHVYAMCSVWLSAASISLGAKVGECIYTQKKKDTKHFLINKDNQKTIQMISLILFGITIIFTFILEIDKYIYMQGREYVEYYLTYQSRLPSIFNLLAGMSTTFLIIFLLTFPDKKKTIIPVSVYIISHIFSFLIGQRNPLVLSVLFVFAYFMMRDYFEKTNQWIGKKEKLVMLIMIPIAIIGMASFNYTRSNEKTNKKGIELFTDFFYTQGVSYNVLNIGYMKMPEIRLMNKNYVFGPIIDYFQENTIAKKIFHFEGLGTGNNVKRALEGNRFTHILAFLSREDYLEGHGYGSSYILELYCNYGFLGITIFSFLLGIILEKIEDLLGKQSIVSIILLYMTSTLFLLPRAETMEPILFLVTPHFWASYFTCGIINILIKRKKETRNESGKIS